MKNKKYFDIDSLLNGINSYRDIDKEVPLSLLFESRLKNLGITRSDALEILNIQSRALKGILGGTQKYIDFTAIVKLANFLQLPKERVVQLYMVELEKNNKIELSYPPNKIEFIKSNFDLVILKKAGVIESITNYPEIEERIMGLYDLKNIFEYRSPKMEVAFSSGLLRGKNELAITNWVAISEVIFKGVNNPYPYNRDKVIEFFGEIRKHSVNVEFGLLNVIKSLYKMGVTVMYFESLPSLHLRGATFPINQKPCIIITNYRGFYATLWFALIHELFHVIFDWDEIKNNKYHCSDTDETQVSVLAKEEEANNFAREYLFSKEKTKTAKAFIHNNFLVEDYAQINDVHPGLIYTFFARDLGEKNVLAWKRANDYNPDIKPFTKHFDFSWGKNTSVKNFINHLKINIYN